MVHKSKEEILKEIFHGAHNKVKLAVTDIDGVLRGKYIHLKKFESIYESDFGFCDVIFGWDSADLCYENTNESALTGWHTGFPDTPCVVDFESFRKIPWDHDVPFFLADARDKDGNAHPLCPRSLLKRIRTRSRDMGYEPAFSQEFEWFNFRETSQELHEKDFRNPNPITKGMFGYSLTRAHQNSEFFNDLFNSLDKFRVPLEGLHTETGPGVYEAAILYGEIVEAADRAVLFKQSAKDIGHKYGIMPTFMAKWNPNLPGCSGHIHQSLWEKNKNIFFDEKDSHKMSALMKSYMAGILKLLPELLPLYAPTINSFKRLVEGMWAPTTLTWGADNRTCALRAIPGSNKSTRVEMRVTGSDTNSYLAMAAVLASGLYGIKNNLSLQEQTKGNGYEDFRFGKLPPNLQVASEKMRDSKVANDLLGEKFVQHFANTRLWECQQYAKAVTDWELKRYFEII